MKALFFTFFILFNFALFSETDTKNIHEFSYGPEIDFSRKGKLESLSYTMKYSFTSPKISTGIGLKTGSDSISSTIYGTYLPLELKSFSLGVKALYNLNLFTGYCIENNLLLGGTLRAGNLDKALFSLDAFYFLKLTDFYKLKIIPLIIDNTFAFSLKLESLIKRKVLICFKLTSYKMHDYPLFFTPIFEFDTSVLLTPKVSLDGFVAVKYSDMFTLTSYLSNIMTGISLKFKLP